jgi:hypothetical protein
MSRSVHDHQHRCRGPAGAAGFLRTTVRLGGVEDASVFVVAVSERGRRCGMGLDPRDGNAPAPAPTGPLRAATFLRFLRG